MITAISPTKAVLRFGIAFFFSSSSIYSDFFHRRYGNIIKKPIIKSILKNISVEDNGSFSE